MSFYIKNFLKFCDTVHFLTGSSISNSLGLTAPLRYKFNKAKAISAELLDLNLKVQLVI